MNVDRYEDKSDFSVLFLRPAPPKMCMRPSVIRANLFPSYQSMPPPVVFPAAQTLAAVPEATSLSSLMITKNPATSFFESSYSELAAIAHFSEHSGDLLTTDETYLEEEETFLQKYLLFYFLSKR
jgi:hypothetical protein